MIMNNNVCLVLLPAVLVLAFLTTYVASLKCVQCLNCIHNLPEPTECTDLGKTRNADDYPTCMKIITKYSDREVITRQCSPAPRDTEVLCSEIKGFEQCIYHCHTDGCNGARGSTSGGHIVSWLSVLLCLSLRFIHV